MKNRDSSGQGKRAERSTEQAGAMPYHRVADAFKDHLKHPDEHLLTPEPSRADKQAHLPQDYQQKNH